MAVTSYQLPATFFLLWISYYLGSASLYRSRFFTVWFDACSLPISFATFYRPYIVSVDSSRRVKLSGSPKRSSGAHCTEVTNNIEPTPDDPEYSP
ncbi:hypothetical protein ASPBRDRAFT_38258 [Aspergillus brasiliensis CBS 101740]|uniref:Uncharacterized protein n=1 Tax=Aspergillus brasiliensis (strain CBS 101740 / IMI 381727 / IBT 21946) TaxID=767769 RepID=A0A1L9UW35_ASPBC|nr:hypothetical protein ASPBRDRAFT_38258 [Aspergillus brasiliensis CBS 101740]